MASAAGLSADAAQLVELLNNQKSPEKELRETSGKTLSSAFGTDPRPFVVALEVLRCPTVADDLKLMLTTHFRRFFTNHFFNVSGVSPDVIAVLRQHLPATLAVTSAKILKLFSPAWPFLVLSDPMHPAWENLDGVVSNLLNDPSSVLVGLTLLRAVLRDHREDNNTQWFTTFIPRLLPMLQSVAPALMAPTAAETHNVDPPEKEAQIALAILKCLEVALSRNVHPVLISQSGDAQLLCGYLEVLPPLLARGGCKNLVAQGDNVRVGTGFGSALKESSEGAFVTAKLRKKICGVLEDIIVVGRLAQYGKKDRGAVLMKVCHGQFAGPIFRVALQMYENVPAGGRIVDLPGITPALHSALLGLIAAVVTAENAEVQAALNDAAQVTTILQTVVLPALQPDQATLNQLRHDPEEFAMQSLERCDFTKAAEVAQKVLISLCSQRTRLLIALELLSKDLATFKESRAAWGSLGADKQRELTLRLVAGLTGIAALVHLLRAAEVGPKKPKMKFKGRSRRTPADEAALAEYKAYTGPRNLLAQVLPKLLDETLELVGAADIPLVRIHALTCLSNIVVELNVDVKLAHDALTPPPADYQSPDAGIREFLAKSDVVLRTVVGCLEDSSDSAVAVQATAGQAMRCIMNKGYKPVIDALAPYAPNFAQAFVKLFEQLDASEFAQALASLIRHFPDQLVDHSMDLLRIIVSRFVSLAKKVYELDSADTQDMSAKAFGSQGAREEAAALATTRTMVQLITALSSYPVLIPELEELLLPLGPEIFGVECAPFYDNFYDIYSQSACQRYLAQEIGSMAPGLDDRYYSVLQKALQTFDADMFSFRKLTYLCDNILSSDLIRFCLAPPSSWSETSTPLMMVIDLCVKEMYSPLGRGTALSLLESVFHQMTRVPAAQIHTPIPSVGQTPFAVTLTAVLRCLGMMPTGMFSAENAKEQSHTAGSIFSSRDRCYVTLAGAFWANPVAALDLLEHLNSLPQVLGLAVDNNDIANDRPEDVSHPPMPVGPVTSTVGRFEIRTFFSNYATWVGQHLAPDEDEMGYDKRATAVGLTSLLGALATRAQLPAGMFGSEAELVYIVEQVVRLVLESYAIQKASEDLESGYDEDDDSDDSSVIDGEDGAGGASAAFAAGGDDDDDGALDALLAGCGDDDDVHSDDDFETDDSFVTPLDDVNEAVYLKETYAKIQALVAAGGASPIATTMVTLLEGVMKQRADELQTAIAFGEKRIADAAKDKEERLADMRNKCTQLMAKRKGGAAAAPAAQ